MNGLKRYSKLHKKDLLKKIQYYFNSIKIQRWIRKILSKGENCSISLEEIKYPCFAYVPKERVVIYYNLYALKEYLISTGDFRDPNTREAYTEEHLKTMDEIDEYYRKRTTLTTPTEPFKSVYKASKNTKVYKNMKIRENEVQILERELDTVIETLITELFEKDEDDDEGRKFTISLFLNTEYKSDLHHLKNRDYEHAKYTIQKNIDTLSHLYSKVKKDCDKYKCDDYEFMISFLYQMMYNEFD